MARIVRAISIRQPYVEQILRETKRWEYRSKTLVSASGLISTPQRPPLHLPLGAQLDCTPETSPLGKSSVLSRSLDRNACLMERMPMPLGDQ